MLLILSAFFSGSETAVTASSIDKISHLASKNRGAKRALHLKENIEDTLSVILLGNNFVNIFLSAITTIIALRLFGEGSVFWVTLLLTFVILIVAEITPKIYAAYHADKLIIVNSGILTLIMKLLFPVVWIITMFSRLLRKFFNAPAAQRHLSDEELQSILVRQSTHNQDRQKIIHQIFHLEKKTVDEVMISTADMVAFDINSSVDQIYLLFEQTHYDYLPICDGRIDHVLGMAHWSVLTEKDLDTEKLREVIERPYFIPESTNLLDQLKLFRDEKKQIGFVVDEYGDIQGMLSIELILEELVGDFTQESFAEEEITFHGSYYIADGQASLHALNEKVGTKFESENAATLNGFLLEIIGSFPQGNVSVQYQGCFFTIIKQSQTAIEKVKIVCQKNKE